MTATPLAAAAMAQLEAEGVDTVIGTRRKPRRAHPGQDGADPPHEHASPIPAWVPARPWHAFAIDQTGIAFTDRVGVVGDQRVRIDLSALRIIGDGLAWAPAAFFEQDGTPVRRVQPRNAEPG